MRLKRTRKEYGGGAGRSIFSSPLFDVTVWVLSGGVRTTLTINQDCPTNNKIHFHGRQELTTDKACFEQLTTRELLGMIKAARTEGFEQGQRYKAKEIKRLLYL